MAARILAFLLMALSVATDQAPPTFSSSPLVREARQLATYLDDSSMATRSVSPNREWNAATQQGAGIGGGDSPMGAYSPVSVSDIDSEAMNIDAPLLSDAMALLEDWQLPPPAHGDSSWSSSTSPVYRKAVSTSYQEDYCSSVSESSPVRRRCQVCTLVDATRGVADGGESGEWEVLLCRHCAQFMNNTVTLSTRCDQCRRYATFGPYGGNRRSARHCKRHQMPGEVNVARKRCEHTAGNGVPCAQPPVYGDEHSGCARFCAWHRKPHHTNLVGGKVLAQLGRRCTDPECEKSATFGDLKTGVMVCSMHKRPQHVDLVHTRRCEHADCQKHPSYGTRSGGGARFCKTHRPWNFIDLKTKKCQHPHGCTKRPSFGDASEGIARFCMQHKARQHVNVKSRKCQEQGCAKQPTFGDEQDTIVRFCAVHRRDSDVDLIHTRCRASDCTKIATFAPRGAPPQYCSQHKDETMDSQQLIGQRSKRAPEIDPILALPSSSSSSSSKSSTPLPSTSAPASALPSPSSSPPASPVPSHHTLLPSSFPLDTTHASLSFRTGESEVSQQEPYPTHPYPPPLSLPLSVVESGRSTTLRSALASPLLPCGMPLLSHLSWSSQQQRERERERGGAGLFGLAGVPSRSSASKMC